MDESCIGEGATHNACSCFITRMQKLERVARAAKKISPRFALVGDVAIGYPADDPLATELAQALADLEIL